MPNAVAEKTNAVKVMEPAWAIATDLMGGTATMRKAGEAYMPKWPNEETVTWQNRVNVATLFPAYSRTVKTLTGKPFSKAITFAVEPSDQIKEWCENIDLQGSNLHSFASDLTETAIGWGLAGILVDCPSAEKLKEGGRVPTQADEQAAGIRPYMVKIWASQLLGWRSQRGENGVEKLLMLRYMETITEPDGEFGEKQTPQIRVLEPGKWRTFREKRNNDGKMEWQQHEEGVTTLQVVPFVPVYGNRIGYMMGVPPMLELAYMNIKHWQSQSDQDTILHVARVPILAVSGVDQGGGDEDGAKKFELTVGASAAVSLPIGGDLKFVEHTGAGIAAGKASLDDLKEEMRQAGAELLVIKPGSITATQTQAEDSIGMCDLQRIIQSVEDSLDQALELMGLWAKDDKPGKVNIHSDFSTLGLAEASAELLHRMWQSGALSIEVLLKELQRRGIIAPDVDLEDEKARIEAGGPVPGIDPAKKPTPTE